MSSVLLSYDSVLRDVFLLFFCTCRSVKDHDLFALDSELNTKACSVNKA